MGRHGGRVAGGAGGEVVRWPAAGRRGGPCDEGYGKGCFNLANRFMHGRGVRKDRARAAALYTKACDEGIAQGCLDLGVLLALGDGVAKDEARAMAALQSGLRPRGRQGLLLPRAIGLVAGGRKSKAIRA